VIEEIIIVSGFACCGKTTFLRALLGGAWPMLASELSINVRGPWTVCNSAWLARLTQQGARPHRAMLEYGILRRETPAWEQDPLLESLLQDASRVLFLVVWCEPEELARRIRKRAVRRILKAPVRLFRKAASSSDASSVRWRLGLPGSPSLATRLHALVRDELSACSTHRRICLRYPNLLSDIYRRWTLFVAKHADADIRIVDVTREPPKLITLEAGWPFVEEA
jgi:hypothetical protein